MLIWQVIADEKWDENAEYIAAAENALPSLIEELFHLRRAFASNKQ
jgi:hypothetical protein